LTHSLDAILSNLVLEKPRPTVTVALQLAICLADLAEVQRSLLQPQVVLLHPPVVVLLLHTWEVPHQLPEAAVQLSHIMASAEGKIFDKYGIQVLNLDF
jgi:hypothetical protein